MKNALENSLNALRKGYLIYNIDKSQKLILRNSFFKFPLFMFFYILSSWCMPVNICSFNYQKADMPLIYTRVTTHSKLPRPVPMYVWIWKKIIDHKQTRLQWNYCVVKIWLERKWKGLHSTFIFTGWMGTGIEGWSPGFELYPFHLPTAWLWLFIIEL